MKRPLIILILGISAAGLFALLSSSPIYEADPVQFDTLGYNLARGHGFSLDNSAPFRPTHFREPFYAVFLAAVYMIFGHNPYAAVLLQIILHAATALIVYTIGRKAFTEKGAFLAGCAVAVFPTLASSSSYLMSETFFAFLLCLGMLVVMKAEEKWRTGLFAAAGLIFGAMTLTKAASLFLPFVLASSLFLSSLRSRAGVRRVAICLLCFLALYLAVVSAWMVRNKKLCGTYSLASRGGVVMWSRAAKVNDSPRQILITACSSLSESLAKVLFPEVSGKPNRVLYKDLEKALALEQKYLKEEKSLAETDEILKKEAFANISMHPVRYISYSFVEWLKMTAFSYVPLLNEIPVENYFSGIAHGIMILTALKGSMRVLGYPIIALFFVGAAKNLASWQKWLALATTVIYFNVIYSFLDAIGRYAVPLIPLYCIFAAAAIFTSSGGLNNGR